MLHSVAFENFRSFKNGFRLSLVAPQNRVKSRYPDNYVRHASGEDILKDVLVVGENASGKTNVAMAFRFLKALFTRADLSAHSYEKLVFASGGTGARADSGRSGEDADVAVGAASVGNGVDAAKAESVQAGGLEDPQRFCIEVAAEGVLYRYALELDARGVTLERLEKRVRKNEVYRTVFERGPASEIYYAGSLPQRAVAHSVRLPDRLFVVALGMMGDADCLAVARWFAGSLVVAMAERDSVPFDGVSWEDMIAAMQDPRYLEILRLVDPSIAGFELDSGRPFEESVVVRRLQSGMPVRRLLQNDSPGVLRFARWALAIYLVVHKGKVVVADGLDSTVSPVLPDRIVGYLNDHTQRGQLVFLTRNIFNLTFRNYMKEQMYIVSKDQVTLESSVRCVADFPDLRYDVKEELYEFYLKGALRSTPCV